MQSNLQSSIPLVSYRAVLIKILYLILVLSTLALLGAAAAIYVRVRRHMATKTHEVESEHRAGGSTAAASTDVIQSTERQ